MKDALEFIEHVTARAWRQRLAFDDRGDKRRLSLEDGLNEVVDGIARDEVGDVDRARLTDPICAVLGLPMVGRHPVEIVEDHLRRRGQVESSSTSDDVRDEDSDVVISLESVDQG